MRKVIIGLLLFLAPALLFAQIEQEQYAMYAYYLLTRAELGGKTNFVIRESTDYGRRNYTGIPLGVKAMRRWFKQPHSSVPSPTAYDSLMHKIKNDTMWNGLMLKLDEKMSRRFVIANKFSPYFNATIISDTDYNKIFGGNGSDKKVWGKFQKKYPTANCLVDLSAVVGDGKRALFYFVRKWYAHGDTSVIFFEKENGKWTYLGTHQIWIIN